MVVKDDSASQSPHHCRPPEWPVVSPGNIGVPDFKADLAYMGFYLELKIRNSSSYLVREAVLRIDGKGPGIEGQITRNGVVPSREVKVGPLFPGVDVVEEVGIGARGGINGLDFITISARAVRLTPPEQMRPAAEYPGLTAEVFEVSVDENAMDFRRREDDGLGEPRTASATSIGVRVRNSGPATVDRVRMSMTLCNLCARTQPFVALGNPSFSLPATMTFFIMLRMGGCYEGCCQGVGRSIREQRGDCRCRHFAAVPQFAYRTLHRARRPHGNRRHGRPLLRTHRYFYSSRVSAG